MAICTMDKTSWKCDVETIFSNPEEEIALLKRLSSYVHECRSTITNFLEEELNNFEVISNKLEHDAELMTQLVNDNKSIEADLEDIYLNQKVLNKKILNSIAIEEALKDDINSKKTQRDALILEMVDLQQELAKQKEMKKKEWNAIKIATAIYKDKLNIHIDLQSQNDCDTLAVSFFIHNENFDRDNYFVLLSHFNNLWQVTKIQPVLKDRYLHEMQLVLGKDYELIDIVRILWQIRNIFLNIKH